MVPEAVSLQSSYTMLQPTPVMHVETSPLEDWLVIVALHRLATDYDDVDPDLASRAHWLAVAIAR